MSEMPSRDDVPPSDTTEFGVDCDGRSHSYSRIENTVYVSDGREFALADTPFRSLGEWCEHVAAICGWEKCTYLGDITSGTANQQTSTPNAGP